jgi:hypothetical protein
MSLSSPQSADEEHFGIGYLMSENYYAQVKRAEKLSSRNIRYIQQTMKSDPW